VECPVFAPGYGGLAARISDGPVMVPSRRAVAVVRVVVAVVALCVSGSAAAQSDPLPGADANQVRDLTMKSVPATGWREAVASSFRLLMLEHTGRIVLQGKTRRELGGPFFSDYVHSIRMPQTWNDGDRWPINYIGHPIHGAAAGFIWLEHDSGASPPSEGFDRAYWTSRGRASLWAAFYSLQFEIGPLSEASIGNVGKNPQTTGWVDHVVTPLGALGIIVTEDVIDRYVIHKLETSTDKRPLQILSRLLLNPSRSLSNIALGRCPWARDDRRLR
jgi:hypothetical protein